MTGKSWNEVLLIYMEWNDVLLIYTSPALLCMLYRMDGETSMEVVASYTLPVVSPPTSNSAVDR